MFDVKRFMATQFVFREEDVPVPDMRDFFPEGEPSVWRVRGLTGQELSVAEETASRNRRELSSVIEKMMATLAAQDAQKAADAVTDPGRITSEIAKRLEMFVIGSVAPEADMSLAIKVCKVRPIEFYSITNAISRLTGQGQDTKKKPTASGTT